MIIGRGLTYTDFYVSGREVEEKGGYSSPTEDKPEVWTWGGNP